MKALRGGEFTTKLTPVECAMKAQAAIVAEPEVVGVVEDSLVLMRKLEGNMFHTVLRANLLPDAEGTTIVLTAGADRIVFVFCLIFLAAFLLIDLFFLLAYSRVFQAYQFSDRDRSDWLFISLPFVSTALGVGLYQLGRYQCRGDKPFLTRVFVEATEAKSKAKAKVKTSPSAPPPRPRTESVADVQG